MKYISEKDELSRICYELCEKTGWDYAELHNRKDISKEEIRSLALSYIRDELRVPLTEKQFWFFLDMKDKIAMNKFKNIIDEMIAVRFISKDKLQDLDWISENLRPSLCHYCYEISRQYNWNVGKIAEYCEERSISIVSFRKLEREYFKTVLQLTDEERIVRQEVRDEALKNNIHERLRECPYGETAKLYNKLLLCKTDEEVIKTIEASGKTYEFLRNGLSDYLIVYHGSSVEITNEMYRKLRVYLTYLQTCRIQKVNLEKAEKKAQYARENLPIARKVISDYIDNEYMSIYGYCKTHNIDYDTFEKFVQLVKENDDELFYLYSNFQAKLKSERCSVLLGKIKEMIKLMKDGIVENEIRRNFDMVDYYQYTTLDFDGLLRFVRGKMSAEEYKILRVFIIKNKEDRKLNSVTLKSLYETKTVIGVKFDAKGNIIPNSGREITKEEKQAIIKVLTDKHIPVTNRTYHAMFRRWLEGTVVIDGYQKVKTKRSK